MTFATKERAIEALRMVEHALESAMLADDGGPRKALEARWDVGATAQRVVRHVKERGKK